jgi:hypothetical protein
LVKILVHDRWCASATMLIRHAKQQLGNQRLLLQCEYLIAENRILRSHVSGRLRLSDAERCTLAEIGKRIGRNCLAEVACVAKPDTILAWYRRLIARKFDGSKHRSYPGRPRVGPELEALILHMARENKSWVTIALPALSPTSAINSLIRVLLQIAAGSCEVMTCVPVCSYAAMPKIVWTNCRCATGSPLATQRT